MNNVPCRKCGKPAAEHIGDDLLCPVPVDRDNYLLNLHQRIADRELTVSPQFRALVQD